MKLFEEFFAFFIAFFMSVTILLIHFSLCLLLFEILTQKSFNVDNYVFDKEKILFVEIYLFVNKETKIVYFI